ncbi:MAG: alpha/beta hydrolase [Firmicutes bacterium]|nr:alpha/beta hydrolase [Bacillota bacterium]
MFLETLGGSIYCEVHGPENQPALVLTHGAGLNCRMFDSQIAALKDKYRIVVWDMPGHGRSHKLDGPLPFTEQSTNIIAILDALNIKQAVLGGQSLGSWVSQHAAVLYPERIQAIISISGVPLEKGTSKLEDFMFKVMNNTFLVLPQKSVFRWVARQKATTPAAQTFAEQSMNEIGVKQFYYIMQGMLAAGSTKISAPSQPLLLTHGEHEMPKYVAKANARWHASIPGSKYVVLPGAGHNGNQDNPQAFNEAVLSFLAEIGL